MLVVNKTVTMLILFILINSILILTCSNSEAEKILYTGGTGTGNYSSIQNAINHASEGDTILVFPGIYNESIIVNKTICLLGKDKNNTIIDTNNSLYSAIIVQAPNISISGFTIQNNTVGIYVIGNVTSFENNIFLNNIFKHNSCGIYLTNLSSGTLIYKNIFSKNQGEGIRLYRSNNNIINENIITENGGFGIALWDSSNNNSITNNTVTNNIKGITFSRWCNNNIIFGNNILENQKAGISFIYSFNNNLTSNYFINNSYGFYLRDSSGNIIDNNNFSKNQQGIHLYDSPNNTINTNNIFYENNQDIWDGSRIIKTPGFEFFPVIFLIILTCLYKRIRKVYRQ